jgi:hypothetical protein
MVVGGGDRGEEGERECATQLCRVHELWVMRVSREYIDRHQEGGPCALSLCAPQSRHPPRVLCILQAWAKPMLHRTR